MASPSTVGFRLEQQELGAATLWTVTPVVDGVSLIELARRHEVVPATAAGEAHLAGNYAGLAVGRAVEPGWQEWYLGHGESWFGDGDTCLLGCTCADVGCWPLTALVELEPETVTWRGFRTGHRDWDLSRLGPFRFSRRQYEQALAEPELG